MKIKLVFDGWQKDGEDISSSEKGFSLSLGPFHSGTTFDAEIKLEWWEEKEIIEAIKNGYTPTFYII